MKILLDKQVTFGSTPHCMKPQNINKSCGRKIKNKIVAANSTCIQSSSNICDILSYQYLDIDRSRVNKVKVNFEQTFLSLKGSKPTNIKEYKRNSYS